MAEIQTNKDHSGKGSKRINKKSTRVDLTPMVDLGFLLITFFVFTTSLTEPRVMQVEMPYDKTLPDDKICESCVITAILDSNNSIKYYEGSVEANPAVQETSFSPGGIRQVLLQKKKAVKLAMGSEDRFVLIIKPSAGSTFKNFVDITDEVTINNIKHYYIDEVSEKDKKWLTGNEAARAL